MIVIEDFEIVRTENDITFTTKGGKVLKAIAPKDIQDDVLDSFEDTIALYNAGVIGDLHVDLIEYLDSVGIIEDKPSL